MGHFREKMSADLLRYGLRRGTRKQYLRYVESYARHFRRSPDKLGSDNIEAWLDHLEKRQGKSEKIRQQALIALKFFYFATLDRPGVAACFPPIGTRKPVCELLSKSDVERLFSAIMSPLHQTVLTVAFGGGLRIGETCRLSVGDIDSQRMLIRLDTSNSGWPQFVALHPETLSTLRKWWRIARPQGDLLFLPRPGDEPLRPGPVQTALREAANRCGFDAATIDNRLRHSFFTHRLAQADNPREVMHILRCTSIRPNSESFIAQKKATSFDACTAGKGGRI